MNGQAMIHALMGAIWQGWQTLVLWWRWLDRWQLWLAYNWAWLNHHGPQGRAGLLAHVQPPLWHESAAHWATIPYAGLIGLERSNTPVVNDANTLLLFVHLVSIPLTAFFLLMVGGLYLSWRQNRPAPAPRVLSPREKAKAAKKEAEDQAADAQRVRDRIALDGLKRGGWLNDAGWPLGRMRGTKRMLYLPPADQATHVLVNGGTGSGKSSRLLLRWLFHEILQIAPKRRASLIVVDPKAGGELTDYTIGLARREGFAVAVYDPTAAGTLRYNPLALAASDEALKRVVDQWIAVMGTNHPHFGRQARLMLAGLLFYLREMAQAGAWQAIADEDERAWFAARPGGGFRSWRDVSMADANDYLSDHDDEGAMAHVATAAARSQNKALRSFAARLALFASDKRDRSAALRGAKDALACCDLPGVADSMRDHAWDWAVFVTRPTILYVPVDMDEAAQLRPLIVAFLTTAAAELHRLAGPGNKTLSRRVRILIDEFVNLGPIDGIERLASTLRFRDVGLALATQGPHDIDNVYGAAAAERLSGNLLTQIVLAKTTLANLKGFVAAAWGLTIDKLMERDTALVQRAGDVPVRVTTRPWFANPLLRWRVNRVRRVVNKATVLYDQAMAYPVATVEKATAQDTDEDGPDLVPTERLAPTVPLSVDVSDDASANRVALNDDDDDEVMGGDGDEADRFADGGDEAWQGEQDRDRKGGEGTGLAGEGRLVRAGDIDRW